MQVPATKFGRRAANLLLALLAIQTLAPGCMRSAARAAGTSADSEFRVIAYVYDGTDIPRISAEKLTHINYAFATLSPEGQVVLENPRAADDLAALNALKTKNPRLKVLLSVGGWGADHFSDAALTAESRSRLAQSAVAALDRHQLDGIDLDWEYPGQPGPGIKFREEDKQNFTLLLEEFRKQLDAYDKQHAEDQRHSLLTIASASGPYFVHTEMGLLHRHLDWINVMTYDLYNRLAKTTGHHTGLFRSAEYGEDPDAHWAEQGIEEHLAAGIPPEKVVLGAAFYGREWEGVPARASRNRTRIPALCQRTFLCGTR